jgi:hypothetical protein
MNFSFDMFDSNARSGTSVGTVTGTCSSGCSSRRNEPVNFGGGILVSLRRRDAILDDSVDEHGDRLGDAIEDQEFVRDQEIHRGRVEFIVRWARHNGFDVVDELVTDESDGAAGESRQTRNSHRAVTLEDALDDFESITHAVFAFFVWPRWDGELFDDFAVFDQLDAIAGLLDDCAGLQPTNE